MAITDNLQKTLQAQIYELKNDFESVLKNAYPVGSIYMSVNNTNPGTLFGGTWVQLKDRFLLGAGSTYTNGKTGGAATHTLTENEIPNHAHTAKGWAAIEDGSGTYRVLGAEGAAEAYNTNFTGGGKAHNNMPPYLVVYMWKRTA